MVKVNIDWNKVREDLDKVLKNYKLFDYFITYGKFSALGNDIVSVMKKHYFGE